MKKEQKSSNANWGKRVTMSRVWVPQAFLIMIGIKPNENILQNLHEKITL